MHCSNKRMSNRKEQLKLKKTYYATRHGYGAGVYLDESDGRLKRYSCNSKGLRQSMNRKYRRKMKQTIAEDERAISSDAHYRKVSDYWNELI